MFEVRKARGRFEERAGVEHARNMRYIGAILRIPYDHLDCVLGIYRELLSFSFVHS